MDINEVTFLDVETTGLSPSDDRIVQIAIKRGDTGISTYINPIVPVTKEAYDVHGLSNDFLKTAPLFKDVIDIIIPLIDNETCKYLCGYNISFDFKFLQAELARASLLVESKEYELLDPLEIHRQLNPRDLSSLYKKYTGQELTKAHDAMADVEACKAILERQIPLAQGQDMVELSGLKGLTIEKWLKISEHGYILNKGKYMDSTLEFIAGSDPGYLIWMMSLPSLSIEEHFILKEFV